MTEQEGQTIRVDRELYSRLRKHCDRVGVRFLDFVENALEDALAAESATECLLGEIEKLRNKTTTYDYAFSRGFAEGFAFLYCMLSGTGMSRVAEEELTIVKKSPPRPIPREQMRLFKESDRGSH